MNRRSYLTLLLLLNYLLVIGAGLVERPARPIDRPFAYVHSPDCQAKHTLRVACFDDCNGVQYTLQKHGQKPPLHALLNSLKALDLHCLPVAVRLMAMPVFEQQQNRVISHETPVLVGFQEALYAPPCRG